MEGYLGEEIVDIHKTEFAMFSQQDWALHWIQRYGGIDGAHHKDWVLDQVVRILNGTKVIVSLAKWSNGQEEYRFRLSEPTKQYLDWVESTKCGDDGEEYGYDEGIAP
jgi:hypothetical protein